MEDIIAKDTIILQDGDTRTVKIYGSYGLSVRETIVQLGTDSCRFVFLQEDEKSESFLLDNETVQKFIDAWMQYQIDQQKKAEAEQARIQAVIAEAFKIAKEHPGIKLVEQGEEDNRSWKVSVPDAGWEPTYPIYSGDNLLRQVKDALQVLQDYQKNLAKDTEFLKKAQDIIESIPEAQLREEEHSLGYQKKKWFLSVPGIYTGHWTLNAEPLYADAKRAYQAWSKTQDKAAQEKTQPLKEGSDELAF